MDTPDIDGHTPRETYSVAKKAGLSTPLDTPPTYPSYYQYILDLFWDLMQYKPEHDVTIPLSVVESYIRLFETPIDSFMLRILLSFDRIYTNEVNKALQDRN